MMKEKMLPEKKWCGILRTFKNRTLQQLILRRLRSYCDIPMELEHMITNKKDADQLTRWLDAAYEESSLETFILRLSR